MPTLTHRYRCRRAFTQKHAETHARLQMHTDACTRLHTNGTHTCIHTHTHTLTHTHTHTHTTRHTKVKDSTQVRTRWGMWQKGPVAGTACSKEPGDKQAAACNSEDLGSIPGSGQSPGGGNDNPLQCSCLENPTDRGARQATVHSGVAKSRTRLSD